MANNLLQRFLDVGLFNFGDDDQRLKDFQAASEDMAIELAKSVGKVIPAVLVAIDPAVPDADPMLDEIESAIKTHWNSFRNKFPDRPTGFLRPVLWDALSRAAAGNPRIASAIWLSGASVQPYMVAPRECGIVQDFLMDQGRIMEAAAAEAWALSPSGTKFTAPIIKFKIPKLQEATLDRSALEEGLGGAAGPHNQANDKRYTNANQNWSNAGPQWSWAFAPRAATAISEQVNKALAPLANQANLLSEQAEPQFNEFSKQISATISQWVNGSAGGLARRSGLLWWKESLYSPSLHIGYRGLSPIEIAVTMALDLNQLAPPPSPQSVEFFLRETIRAALPKDQEVSVSEVLSEVAGSRVLRNLFPSDALPTSPRRISLLTAIQFSMQMKLEDKALPAWIGVKADLKQPVAELAVWLFRDAQALALTQQ